MRKNYLLSPGPTPVLTDALAEMSKPIIHHRTPEFSKIFLEAEEGLKYVFQTEQDVIILAASGTGAMEASVTNLLSKGDKAIVIDGGKFGHRWGEICEAYGVEVVWIEVEWGKAVDVNVVEDALKKNPDVKAIFVQASETSTTVAHPVKELAELTKGKDNLALVVDGITAVGVMDIPMDKWGIDVLVSGSQKAFMLPPGLAFVAFSEKAWKMAETSNLPHYYFDLKKERKSLGKATSAYTPAVSLIIGLNTVLKKVKEEGLENIFKTSEILARATRAGLMSMGLKLVAPESPANSATGAYVPENINSDELTKYMRDVMGVTIAGGQEQLKGKIVRIAHMGFIDAFDIVVALSALEMALEKFGYKVERGKGVSAAIEILREGFPEV